MPHIGCVLTSAAPPPPERPVASRAGTVHSVRMSPEHDNAFYWCLRHSRVESGDDVCAGKYRLGPYATDAEAKRALNLVRERNDRWEAEDRDWGSDH